MWQVWTLSLLMTMLAASGKSAPTTVEEAPGSNVELNTIMALISLPTAALTVLLVLTIWCCLTLAVQPAGGPTHPLQEAELPLPQEDAELQTVQGVGLDANVAQESLYQRNLSMALVTGR